MKFNELTIDSSKKTNRVGRGISAGQGKTAGRGTKGQNSRAGSSRKPGFEGGQNPLMQRLPKLRGFTSHKSQPETVYTGQLNNLDSNIDNHKLYEAGLVSSPFVRVKLISNGELTKKVSVKLQLASAGAIAAVKKAGGVFTISPQIGRPKKLSVNKKS